MTPITTDPCVLSPSLKGSFTELVRSQSETEEIFEYQQVLGKMERRIRLAQLSREQVRSKLNPSVAFGLIPKNGFIIWIFGLVSPADAGVEKLISEAVRSKGGTRAVNVKMKYRMSFVNGLLSLITFTLYSPFTLTVEGDVVGEKAGTKK